MHVLYHYEHDPGNGWTAASLPLALTLAPTPHMLSQAMGLNKKGQKIATEKTPPAFGAAADGDADRNMIMGSQFFCSREPPR